ncbi:MAG: hypothetical protein INR68_18550 [Methylobacterium mesophilicum]|nr:hypothetical protein [Methylobacterium mesophilicum]
MASVKGGDLFDKVLKDLADKLDEDAFVRVGFIEGSVYPDGTPTPLVAAVQEFGAPARKIPPRPFFRSMLAEKSPAWPKAVGDLLVRNSYDVKKTLAQAGEAIAGQLRESIVATNSPPLSPKTIAAKGFDTPLIDTGHLLASVSYQVED